MIQKVEAVVLRSMNYRESSKILTLYTRQFGAMGVIVKGARRSQNKYGASLEPLAHIHAVVYKKETRDLQLLTEAELVCSFPKIQSDFEKFFLALSVLELTYVVTRHSEQNESLFDLLVSVLEEMESATNSVLLLFYYFEVQLIKLLGFQPSIHSCEACGRAVTEVVKQEPRRVLFEYDRGIFHCSQCLPSIDESLSIDSEAVALWEQLAHLHVKYVRATEWKQSIQGELDRLLTQYLERHQPEMRKIQAKRMFDSIQPST